jgi:hypothetical protein
VASVEVSVYGSRVFDEDWREAQHRPTNALPELTPAQRNTAKQLHVSEEDYARMFLAQQLSADRLVEKTAEFGNLLERSIQARGIDASVRSIKLDDLHQRYEVEVQANGTQVPLTIDGQLVQDLLERGSAEAEASISRIIDLSLGRRVIA